MPAAPSYLQQRQQARRWRVVTALVAAGALAAAAVWTLDNYGQPAGGTLRTGNSAAPSAAPAPPRT